MIFKINDYHDNDEVYFDLIDNDYICNEMKSGQIWEKHMHSIFTKYIDKNSIVLEAGSHVGTHSVKLAKLCNTLHAFEPMPILNKYLRNNILINNLSNVIIYNNGLSNSIGETSYDWISNHNLGASGLKNNPMGNPHGKSTNINISVSLITIDSLNLSKLDFIKIDVEGYEEFVIQGGLETIKRCKPIITIEVWMNHFGQHNIEYTKNKYKNLIDIGYSVSHVGGPDFLFLPQ